MATRNDYATVIGLYVGTSELNNQPDVMVSLKSDQAGTEYFDFSNDNTNWDTFPVSGFAVSANIHEFHTAVKGKRYFTYTVPYKNTLLIKKINLSITRASGAAGSAYISLRVRESGKVYRTLESYDLSTGSILDQKRFGGFKIPVLADIKFRVE